MLDFYPLVSGRWVLFYGHALKPHQSFTEWLISNFSSSLNQGCRRPLLRAFALPCIFVMILLIHLKIVLLSLLWFLPCREIPMVYPGFGFPFPFSKSGTEMSGKGIHSFIHQTYWGIVLLCMDKAGLQHHFSSLWEGGGEEAGLSSFRFQTRSGTWYSCHFP